MVGEGNRCVRKRILRIAIHFRNLRCHDAGLAALDRLLAQVYAKALKNWPQQEAATQRTLQRGWIKGRNECSGAGKACLGG